MAFETIHRPLFTESKNVNFSNDSPVSSNHNGAFCEVGYFSEIKQNSYIIIYQLILAIEAYVRTVPFHDDPTPLDQPRLYTHCIILIIQLIIGHLWLHCIATKKVAPRIYISSFKMSICIFRPHYKKTIVPVFSESENCKQNKTYFHRIFRWQGSW